MFQNLSFSNLYQLIDNSANEKIFQAILVFIIFYLLLKIFKLTIISRLQRIADQTPSKLDDLSIKIVNSYGSLFYIFTPLYITSLITSISTRIDSILYKSSVIIFIYYIAKTVAAIIIFVVTNSLRTHYQNNKEKIDPTLENLVALIVRLVVWSIAIILVLQNLNYNISALLGGLGILGVAVAFGMQNILADLFSFFTIYLDKPFKSGDYVIINDLQSGTIKHIGLKSTRIKTLKGDELIIPNQSITKSIINNYKRMKNRRVDFDLSIAYDTPQNKIKKIPALIATIIQQVPNIKFVHCKLCRLDEYSIIYTCAYTIDNSDYEIYLNIREEILLKILASFQKNRIALAYPTQSILLNKK